MFDMPRYPDLLRTGSGILPEVNGHRVRISHPRILGFSKLCQIHLLYGIETGSPQPHHGLRTCPNCHRISAPDDGKRRHSQDVGTALAKVEPTRSAVLIELDIVETPSRERVFDQRIFVIVIAIVVEIDLLSG